MYLCITEFKYAQLHNYLTILHPNIRSLNKNFDELHKFLVSFRAKPDVIWFTETQIKIDLLVNITIPQYNSYHANFLTSAGRVAVDVSDNFTCKLCLNQYEMPNCECLWLKLSTSNSNEKFIVGTLHRHLDHSTVNIFW